jgi:hypothetical protein
MPGPQPGEPDHGCAFAFEERIIAPRTTAKTADVLACMARVSLKARLTCVTIGKRQESGLRQIKTERAIFICIAAMEWRRHFDWIWKSIVASGCGSLVHLLLMEFKTRTGLLPGFDPSTALEAALSRVLADAIPLNIAPWLFSQLNGATLIGLLFGRFFHLLPGGSGLAKGFILGVAGWLVLTMVLFPALGFGVFAFSLGLGVGPTVFSLAMVQAYSLVLGVVYAALQRREFK